MILEEVKPLVPIHFFRFSADLNYGKVLFPFKTYLLSDPSKWFGEESFGQVALAWNPEGILAEVLFDKEFAEGDSVELFIDTRDLKNAGFPHQFCHHFFITPEGGSEITQFRTEDRHPLCDPKGIDVKTDFGKSNYRVHIFISSQCLHGYDTTLFDRIGFTYRLNRLRREPQHFVVSSRFYGIPQHPSLWATLKMRKG